MKPVAAALLVPVAVLLMAPAPARAASPGAAFADPARIDGEVARFTGMPPGTTGGAAQPADRRLRLAACANPLSLGWYAGRRDTVLVQCPDAGGWRLFVPVLQPAAGAAAEGPAVLRGEAVTIAVAGPGFSVTQPGEALEAGAVGAWIRVRTAANVQPMRARIVRPGLVSVAVGEE
ncbi:flagella basal body P-ring formation protein FlgA [Novosphingobium bradum]|uniref:Flagella basal body P-ring formation protein FlgA n=1 Tax=Novosphingobium bradum TaxID=1737444 RepID=A0ABV7IWL7_9SPHN